jgi:uncharacterized protein with GYD domain
MPYAICLLKLDKEGKRAIKDSSKRIEAAKKAVQAFGGKWVEIYTTLGEYDYIAIVENNSTENILATSAAISSTGEVNIKTLVGFNEAEWKKILGKLPDVITQG